MAQPIYKNKYEKYRKTHCKRILCEECKKTYVQCNKNKHVRNKFHKLIVYCKKKMIEQRLHCLVAKAKLEIIET